MKTKLISTNRYDAVIISENGNLLEVSVIFDRLTFKVKEYNYRLLTRLDDACARWIGQPENYVTQKAIASAKRRIAKNLKQVRQTISSAKFHPAWARMVEIVELTVKNYKGDFYFFDCLILGGLNPSQKFIWLVRDSGTHFHLEQNVWASTCIDTARNITSYVWDGENLQRVDKPALIAFYRTLTNTEG